MKNDILCKKLFGILFLIGFCVDIDVIHAQISKKWEGRRYHAGMGVEIFPLNELNGSLYRFQPSFLSLNIGITCPILNWKDQLSLNLQNNLIFGFSLPQQVGFPYLIKIPTNVIVRYGSNASIFNEQYLGIGAGIGLDINYFNTDLNRIQVFTATPSWILELNSKPGKLPFTLAFHGNLFSKKIILDQRMQILKGYGFLLQLYFR